MGVFNLSFPSVSWRCGGVKAVVWPGLGQAVGLSLMPGGPTAPRGWCEGQNAPFGVKDVPEEFDARKSADGTNIGSTANASESIIGEGMKPDGGA